MSEISRVSYIVCQFIYSQKNGEVVKLVRVIGWMGTEGSLLKKDLGFWVLKATEDFLIGNKSSQAGNDF